MVHISKKQLNKRSVNRIHEIFFEMILKNASKNEMEKFVSEIFTLTERVMFTKRAAAMYLIIKGLSQRDIAEILHISSSTVSRYSVIIDNSNGKVKNTVLKMIKRENIEQHLDDIVSGLLVQPGIRVGSWQEYWNYKKRKSARKSLGI